MLVKCIDILGLEVGEGFAKQMKSTNREIYSLHKDVGLIKCKTKV